MEPHSYTTIQQPSEGSYGEKGSKFLAFAYRVESEEEIRGKIEGLKKEYFDARHHCFAWTLGPDRKLFRSFDDGEPNHSAGDPILGQIRSKGLTNVLVVVVRYFGGVKLGVGGLIAAYKAAAADALNRAVVVNVEVRFTVRVEYDYVATPEVMKLIKDFALQITSQNFGVRSVMMLSAPLHAKQKLMEKIQLLQALGTDLKIRLINC